MTDAIPTIRKDDLVGRIVAGKYRVTARVAKGGMAWIFRAEQLPLGRVVALKLLTPPGDERSSTLETRFLREAATCARLRHPNTVTLYDYGAQEDGTFYMVMEFVEGRTLAQEIRNRGPIEPTRAVRIAMEILRSLQEAHSAGIVHRDLKPSNIMLADTMEGESVKVLDFGIAKILEEVETDHITADSQFIGSPGYMAPEQIARKPVDGRTDLYALGVVMFEMLTGKVPFKGKTPVQTLMAHLKDDPPPVSKLCPTPIPESLTQIIASCLSKDLAGRPVSAADMRRQLRDVLHEFGVPTDIDSSTVSEFQHRTSTLAPRPSGRATALVGLGAVAMVVGALLFTIPLAILTAWLAVGPSRPPVPDPPPPSVPMTDLVVRLRSDPPGAMAYEGDRSLGITPINLRFAGPDAPARRITLSLPGHEPTEIEIAPGEHDREEIAKLTPIPVPVAPPAPAPAPAPVPPKPAPSGFIFER